MFPKGSFIFAGVFVTLGVAIAVASLFGEPRRELTATVSTRPEQMVSAAELADWLIAGRRDFAVVDMRTAAAYERAHIRTAINCGSCHESRSEGLAAQQSETFVDLSKKLVLYTETDREPITLPRLLQENPRVYRLTGGYAAWREQVLAPVNLEGLVDEASVAAAKKREAVRAFMAGERAVAPNVAKLPVTPIKRSGAHKISGSNEGC